MRLPLWARSHANISANSSGFGAAVAGIARRWSTPRVSPAPRQEILSERFLFFLLLCSFFSHGFGKLPIACRRRGRERSNSNSSSRRPKTSCGFSAACHSRLLAQCHVDFQRATTRTRCQCVCARVRKRACALVFLSVFISPSLALALLGGRWDKCFWISCFSPHPSLPAATPSLFHGPPPLPLPPPLSLFFSTHCVSLLFFPLVSVSCLQAHEVQRAKRFLLRPAMSETVRARGREIALVNSLHGCHIKYMAAI